MPDAVNQSQPQPLAAPAGLDQAVVSNLVRDVIAGLAEQPDASLQTIADVQESAVAAALNFRPRNAQEAMLAVRVVIADRASTDCFRRAGLADLPHDLVLRYHARAAALARLSMATAAALCQLQRSPAPPLLRAGSAAAVIAAVCGRARGPAAAAPAPLPAAAANDARKPMPDAGPAARPAEARNAAQDPMHREAPAPANGRQHPMTGGVPGSRPRSAIELPPSPMQAFADRVADDVLRMGRKVALVDTE